MKRVLTNARALAAAAAGVLDPEEQAALRRPAGARKLDDEPWSLPELVLIDEAEALLNGVGRTYGHAVVDEAQDLSAMELRAVARRCPSRSMTVLGDLAQATAPGAVRSWEAAVEHLGSPANASDRGARARLPRPGADPGRRQPAAARGRPRGARRRGPCGVDGDPPTRQPCAPDELAADRGGAWSPSWPSTWGSVGVVVPSPLVAEVARRPSPPPAWPSAPARRGGLGGVVTLLEPPEAKGLEFDAVVVVEPAAFFAQHGGGRLLYIAPHAAPCSRSPSCTPAPLPEALVG